jgi:disulfide bond formation protein DsbB
MHNFKSEFYLILIFLISLIAITSAYFIEYILGHQPCNLCLLERIPYLLSLIILLINYKFKNNQKYHILLLILIFIFSLIISIYHFGIEQGFFQESLVCDLKSGFDIILKEDLLNELEKKTVSCKDVTLSIFGFSLTTINIFINLLFLFLLTKIFIFYEKNKL